MFFVKVITIIDLNLNDKNVYSIYNLVCNFMKSINASTDNTVKDILKHVYFIKA